MNHSVSLVSCCNPLVADPPPAAQRLNQSAFCAVLPWMISVSLRGMPAMNSCAKTGNAMTDAAAATTSLRMRFICFPNDSLHRSAFFVYYRQYALIDNPDLWE